MKKLISLTLALLLVLSLTVTAFAADDTFTAPAPQELGSITISGASASNIYSVYRLLDLESYDKDSGAYSYKVNSDWEAFFNTDEAKAYFSVDSVGYATWVGSDDADRVIAFSQLALEYAKDNDINYIQCSEDIENFITTNEDGSTYGKFSDLPLGYYLVDSTMGALCGLTTTNPDATITAKNHAPSIDKQVQEDSNHQWGASNTAGIGESVNYRVTITVTGGAENYTLHDTMSEGLTFEPDSVTATLNGTDVDASNFEVITETEDGCTFDIAFDEAFTASLSDGDQLVVHYSATLNEKAVIGSDASDQNKARLEFGEDHYTEYDSVATYTYGIEIIKTDDQGTTLLDGAEFLIYDAQNGGNIIPVIAETDAEGNVIRYRVAMADELTEEKPNGDTIVVKDGRIKVDGFDNNLAGESYWLEEVTAPEGYNQLTARQGFRINGANLYATFLDGTYSAGTGVQVKNKTGSVLPTTGAAGTMMFITTGMFVVLATGVLLVTKKRMSMIEE